MNGAFADTGSADPGNFASLPPEPRLHHARMKANAVNRRQFLAQSAAVAAVLSIAVLAPGVAHAGAATADEVAENVQKFYDGTKTYRAGFKQVYFIKVQNKKKES